MKTNLLLVLMSLSLTSIVHAAPDATIQADNTNINSACGDDAKTAGCGGEVVGKGLLRCLHAYKKSNPSYKFSPACKTAMVQRHSDKVSGK